MNEGYKNWPIVRKMLIDNRLEHAALLAYSIDVSEQMFVMRARSAYRKVDVRVDEAVAIRNDAAGELANALAKEEAKAALARSRDGEDDPATTTEPVKVPKVDPSIEVTLSRETDEPKKED